MITFFTTAKPFRGHDGITQRNALKSWTLLHPDAEVILFGNDEGAEKVCAELGLRHEREVERSRLGAVRADDLFARAQEIARHELLCYSNCDIVLTREFCKALTVVGERGHAFLMVGRRWDTPITEPIDFSGAEWEEEIVGRAKSEGVQRFYDNIDYFAFRRGLYREMPALVVGRTWWDHWMVWKALAQKAVVVDASETVYAVHQNHDYSHLAEGLKSLSSDEDAQRNFELAGGRAHLRTTEDATYRLTEGGVVANRFYWMAPTKRRWRDVGRKVRGALRMKVWHPFLDVTRPMRHTVGLNKDSLPALIRNRKKRHWMDE
ncbi:MAG: hypothetical protein WA299_03560 [Candidatus Acidiferrum sp.]